MSWQAYVDTSLCGSGHIDKAAIISIAGDSVWASTAGFTIKPEEMKKLVSILETQAAKEKAQAEGVYVGGVRYVVAKIEDDNFYVRQGKTGILVHKTKQAVLVAHHLENTIAGNASQTVGALADYLTKQGY